MDEQKSNVVGEPGAQLSLFTNSTRPYGDVFNRGGANYAGFFSKSYGGRRDMYNLLGYAESPSCETYLAKYLRQDIARRIVNAFPDAIWLHHPKICEDEDYESDTPFETEFKKLALKLNLFHYFNRADRLAGIGRFSLLLIGVRDGAKDLREPMGDLEGIDDIIYLTPYAEYSVEIDEWETAITNPRYGKPKVYRIRTGGDQLGYQGSTMPQSSMLVHYSRVLHIAENCMDNDTYGTPKLEPVLNRLDDLEKVVGGSAESFWLNARGGLNLNVRDGTILRDADKLQKHAEDFQHNSLMRILQTVSMDVLPIEFKVATPEMHAAIIIDLISGAIGIPKRVLLGSERGELASSQDEHNWISRVDERRRNFCEVSILRPFINLLVEKGALPPIDNYDITWPPLMSLSEHAKAEIAVKVSTALSQYVNAIGADQLIPVEQFVKTILGQEFLPKAIEDSEFMDEMLEAQDTKTAEKDNDAKPKGPDSRYNPPA